MTRFKDEEDVRRGLEEAGGRRWRDKLFLSSTLHTRWRKTWCDADNGKIHSNFCPYTTLQHKKEAKRRKSRSRPLINEQRPSKPPTVYTRRKSTTRANWTADIFEWGRSKTLSCSLFQSFLPSLKKANYDHVLASASRELERAPMAARKASVRKEMLGGNPRGSSRDYFTLWRGVHPWMLLNWRRKRRKKVPCRN